MQNTEIITFWNQESRLWKMHEQFGTAFGEIRSFIYDQVQPHIARLPSDATILDLGSGADNTAYLDLPRQQRVINVDISPLMLKRNGAKSMVQADLTSPLPIRSASIDFVTSFFVIRYLSNKDHVLLLKEIRRVLKPEGTFLVIDLPKNKYPHQQSVCSPESLAQVASSIGFTNAVGKTTELSYRYGFETGFGWCGGEEHFDIGCVTGVKPLEPFPQDDVAAEMRYITSKVEWMEVPKEAIGF